MTGSGPNKELGSAEYLALAFEPSDRLAILIRNAERKETIQRITTAAKVSQPSFQDWLRYKNFRERFDVYVGMNPLRPDARTRTKEDILAIRHLYVDLDYNGPVSLAAIQGSHTVPAPNYVVTTSPERYQVIWRVEEASQEQAERLLVLMAKAYGGDPAATDSTRVLRLPGFLNRKYEADFVVKAEHQSQRLNHFQEFKLRSEHGDAFHDLARGSTRPRTSENRPLSQSEHDWAFAKRALVRGSDPEEIIRSITRFREGEKNDPLDYARRTVAKAAAQLQHEPQTAGTDASEPRIPERDLNH